MIVLYASFPIDPDRRGEALEQIEVQAFEEALPGLLAGEPEVVRSISRVRPSSSCSGRTLLPGSATRRCWI